MTRNCDATSRVEGRGGGEEAKYVGSSRSCPLQNNNNNNNNNNNKSLDKKYCAKIFLILKKSFINFIN